MPVPVMTFAVVPMSIAPSVLIVVTKLVRVAVSRVSLSPKVTPPSASVIVNAPMLRVAPMSALKKIDAVPTSRVRSFFVLASLSIVALDVNVIEPPEAPVASVFIATADCSSILPLKRTASSLVRIVSVEAPPLKMMPPVISSAFVVPEPMLMRPSVRTSVTGPLAPVLDVSAPPKVTPPLAVSTMKSLSR